MMHATMSATKAGSGLRRAGRLFAALSVLAFGVYVIELSFVRVRYFEAARLVDSVRGLRIGVSTSEDVRQLSERFAGKLYPVGPLIRRSLPVESSPTYFLMVTSPYIAFRDHYFHPVGPGIRFWSVAANLSVKDGYLSESSLEVSVQRSDDVSLISHLSVTSELLVGPPGYSYYVIEPHVTGPPTEALHVNITPDANFDERRKAFVLGMRCLTSLRECRHVCELSPSAWPDLGDHRLFYEDGHEKIVEAECEKSLAVNK